MDFGSLFVTKYLRHYFTLSHSPVGVEGTWQRGRQQYRTNNNFLVQTEGSDLFKYFIKIHGWYDNQTAVQIFITSSVGFLK